MQNVLKQIPRPTELLLVKTKQYMLENLRMTDNGMKSDKESKLD